ncbi:MAG: hypothetical protein F4Z17_04700 [Acidimicrobiia bacterium]|nr:hypothetical protein [Acidimicrobiia bacterium]
MARMRRHLRDLPVPAGQAPAAVGWLVLVGLLVVAALWASEPGGAHPTETSWRPGRTVATWDWEQHWNYWRKLVCRQSIVDTGTGEITCGRWQAVGNQWRACGPRISPPQPRINSCGIGRGGHAPHGDGVTVKYQYLNRHEDRLGPRYNVCAGDRNLPANTSPGNCGTWVNVNHAHCADDPSAHPPDCPTTTGNRETTPSVTDTTRGTTATTRPATTTTRRRTTSTWGTTATTRPATPTTPTTPTTQGPPPPPPACTIAGAVNSFHDTIDAMATPSLGFQPVRNGYVRVPVHARYQGDPSRTYSERINGERVSIRVWVSRMSWVMTGLGRPDGTELGIRTFHRNAPDYHAAGSLKSPFEVRFGGDEAVYLRSSLRAGYPSGYPVALTVVWSGECQESGTSDWTSLGTRSQDAGFSYKVFAIRSRPS